MAKVINRDETHKGFIDLDKNELRNAQIQNLASDPASPDEGQIWYRTDTDRMMIWANGAAEELATMDDIGGGSVVSVVAGHGVDVDATDPANPIVAVDETELTVPGTQTSIDASGFTYFTTDKDDLQVFAEAVDANLGEIDTALYGHIGDTTDAHPASAITFTPAQGIAATNTQAAIEEVVTDLTASITAATEGKAWKDPVRVAVTTNVTLASAVENGDTLDGVVIATGDRVGLFGQTAGAESGIFTVNASGAPTRAADMNTAAEANNATVLVEEGTANKGDTYTQTATIVTIGTTAMVWAKSGEGNTVYTADGTSVTLTGSTFSRNALTGDVTASAGSSATTIPNDTVDNARLANMVQATIKGRADAAGTGDPTDLTAAQVRTILGIAGKFSQDLTGGATSEVITHNLGTRDVVVQIRNQSTPWAYEDFEVEATSTNTVTIRAAATIAGSTFRAIITG